MNKKLFLGFFAGIMCVGALGVSALTGNTDGFFMANGGDVDLSKTFVFDETTRAQYGYDWSSTTSFTNSELKINDYFTLEMTNCARSNDAKNWFARVTGGSKIAKKEESYNITSFMMNGSHPSEFPVVKFYVNKGDTEFYKPSYTKGVAFDVRGYNYFTIEIPTTQNIEFSYTYGCDAKYIINDQTKLKAELKEGIVYGEGVVPSINDFNVYMVNDGKKLKLTKDVNMSYPEDFATNGGDITFSYLELNDVVTDVPFLHKTGTATRFEAEDSTIEGATGLIQLKEFADPLNPAEGTEYTTVGAKCDYCKMHAGVYLNFPDGCSYKSSASEGHLSGLVHNFDSGKNGKMTFTIEAQEEMYAVLSARAASNLSNDAGNGVKPLDLRGRLNLSLNDEDLTSRLNNNCVLKQFNVTEDDPYNRTGSINGLNLNLRIRFLGWTELNLMIVKLNKGTNTLIMSAHDSTSEKGSGQWDYIELTKVA